MRQIIRASGEVIDLLHPHSLEQLRMLLDRPQIACVYLGGKYCMVLGDSTGLPFNAKATALHAELTKEPDAWPIHGDVVFIPSSESLLHGKLCRD